MSYRILPCLALNEMQQLFMVQVRLGNRWLNCREGPHACLFRSKLEAEMYIDFERLASA